MRRNALALLPPKLGVVGAWNRRQRFPPGHRRPPALWTSPFPKLPDPPNCPAASTFPPKVCPETRRQQPRDALVFTKRTSTCPRSHESVPKSLLPYMLSSGPAGPPWAHPMSPGSGVGIAPSPPSCILTQRQAIRLKKYVPAIRVAAGALRRGHRQQTAKAIVRV